MQILDALPGVNEKHDDFQENNMCWLPNTMEIDDSSMGINV